MSTEDEDQKFTLNTFGRNNKQTKTRMWANAQPDGRPAKHR